MQIWMEDDLVPRDYTMQVDETPLSLVGASVELFLRDVDGNLVDTAGKLTINADPSTGIVEFAPAAGDLVPDKSPYTALWKITFLDLTYQYHPGSGPDHWVVRALHSPANVMTFGALRKQVLRWLDAMEEYGTGNNLDELVKQQINTANVQRCSECTWDFLKTTTVVPITAGQRRATLPGNVGRLESLWMASQGYLTHVPKRMQDTYGVTRDWTVSGSFNTTPFEVEGTTIRFLEPPPAGDLYISYRKTPIPLHQPDDISDIPYPHTQLLVWDALLDLKSYATETQHAAIWLAKQLKAEAALYDSQKEGQILGGIVPSIRPGSELR